MLEFINNTLDLYFEAHDVISNLNRVLNIKMHIIVRNVHIYCMHKDKYSNKLIISRSWNDTDKQFCL